MVAAGRKFYVLKCTSGDKLTVTGQWWQTLRSGSYNCGKKNHFWQKMLHPVNFSALKTSKLLGSQSTLLCKVKIRLLGKNTKQSTSMNKYHIPGTCQGTIIPFCQLG